MDKKTKKEKMKLLITIDTECDNAWGCKNIITTNNARYIPRFQELCEQYNFKPTYLTAYEMAKDDFFVEFATDILRRGTGEIGAHPHAWNTPPEFRLTSNDFINHPYLIEYPEHVMRRKIEFLTKSLEDTFGTKIFSHRAGKWGFDAKYAQILDELNYRVDCSVTPHIIWKRKKRSAKDLACPTINYSDFPDKPYFLSSDDIHLAGDLKVLEIPVTVLPRYGKIMQNIYNRAKGRLIPQILSFLYGSAVLWFRPLPYCLKHLKKIAQLCLEMDSDYIMLMLHSSEIMPGGSPYFKTRNDVELLYDKVEEVFCFLASKGIEGYTCKDFYAYYCNKEKKRLKIPQSFDHDKKAY